MTPVIGRTLRRTSRMKSRLRTVAGALSGQTLGPRAAVLVLGHEQPVPIFQQLARSHPSGRDDVRQIPAVAAHRRGSFGRAWDRHQPRARPVLVERVWADIRRRDPKEADHADASLSSIALAFGRGDCEGQWQALLSLARSRSWGRGVGTDGYREAGQACGAETSQAHLEGIWRSAENRH